MLTQMRANMKVIMLILVAAFVATIVFSWGMDYRGPQGSAGRGIVGVINGREISYDYFFRMLQNEYTRIREVTGSEPDESRMIQVRDQLWEQLVNETLIAEEVEKRGITLTDDEVIFIIRNSPPDFLRSEPSFQTDGVFDPQKYMQLLNNPGVNWASVENAVREIYPSNKLRSLVLSTVRITDAEVREEFLNREETVSIRYMYRGPDQFMDEPVTVSDDDLRAYYDDHQDEFTDPETRNIRYVMFPTTMTAADSQTVRKQVEDLMTRARDGEDFAELASLYSQDPSVENNKGDLGTFARGHMIQAFEDAAFAAKPGDILGPIETQFGLHLIKIHDQVANRGKVDSVHASHILLRMELPSERADDLRYDARFFADLAQEKGLIAAAQEETLMVMDTPPIQEGGFIVGIGRSPELSRFLFHGKVGDVSSALETTNGWIVAEIAAINEKKLVPFDQASATIRNILERNKRKELAHQSLEQVKQQRQANETLADLQAKTNINVVTSEPFHRNDFVPMVGREPQFIGAAFKLQPGEIAGPVETTQGWYLMELAARTTPDSMAQRVTGSNVRQELLSRKQQITYATWMQNLREKAEIEDYRDQFWR